MLFYCSSCDKAVASTAITATCEDCGGFLRYTEESSDRLTAAVNGDLYAALPDVETPVRIMGVTRLSSISEMRDRR